MRREQGFTLIELLVAIVIIGILAAVAIPQYTRYVQRGDLVEGTNALAAYRVQMEQWYQDNNSYANGAACGVVPPATPPLVNFTVACALNGGAQAYIATATSLGPIAGFKYTVDQNNNQATPQAPQGWATSTTGWTTR
ncbi:MAG: prepilin-type N-terminal cleavage/methylation domain-containing protein [Burkholderiaceae bacterium]|nr:prepilin-type N-terminal cleavage/methylation domain-containing protein [Burkholderiaceae bacterium]